MTQPTKAMLIVVGVALGIQLLRPTKTNPPIDPSRTAEARLQIPPDVQHILNRSCNDCHSNNTVWPWYSNVAPMSWGVIDDVNHGRRHLNFSDWAKYDASHADHKLEQICDEVKDGGMPLVSYTWFHKGTKLTQSERDVVCGWTAGERKRLAGLPGDQK